MFSFKGLSRNFRKIAFRTLETRTQQTKSFPPLPHSDLLPRSHNRPSSSFVLSKLNPTTTSHNMIFNRRKRSSLNNLQTSRPYATSGSNLIPSSGDTIPPINRIKYSWSYYQDEMELTAELADNINSQITKGSIPQGSTILLAARIMKSLSNTTFTLNGVDVVMLAEEYVGHGVIQVLPIRTKTLASPVNNNESEDGHLGADGNAGRQVILGFLKISGNISVTANGGDGGAGQQGGKGSDGNDGITNNPFEPNDKNVFYYVSTKQDTSLSGRAYAALGNPIILPDEDIPYASCNASAAQLPGYGGPGGAGNKGGDIYIIFHETSPQTTFHVSHSIGKYGETGQDGNLGKDGRPTIVCSHDKKYTFWGGYLIFPPTYYHPRPRPGTPININALMNPPKGAAVGKPSESEFWKRIFPLMGDWSEYRLQQGEFHYRCNNLTSASYEFQKVTEMVGFDIVYNSPSSSNPLSRTRAWRKPAGERASSFLNQINNNHNVLGQPRYLDVYPNSFEDYLKIYDEAQITFSNVHDTYKSGIDILEKKKTQDDIIKMVDAIHDHYGEIIHQNLVQANADNDKVSNLETLISDRTDNLGQKINQLLAAKQTLKDAHASDEFYGAIQSTIELIGSIVTVVSAGFSVVPIAMAFIATTAAIKKLQESQTQKEFDKNKEDFDKMVTGRLKDAADAIKAAGPAAVVILKHTHIINEIETVPLTSAYLEYQLLMRDCADGLYQLALLKTQLVQAQLAAQVTKTTLEGATRDQQRSDDLKSFIHENNPDQKNDEKCALELFAVAQRKMDRLNNFFFQAQRATEIYTVQTYARGIPYQRCYLAPQDLQKYQNGLLSFEQYLNCLEEAFNLNTTTSIDPAFLRTAWLANKDFMDGQYSIVLKDASLLSDFKTKQKLSFKVVLEDFEAQEIREDQGKKFIPYEDKIIWVYVALVGAESSNITGRINITLNHLGVYSQRFYSGIREITVDSSLEEQSESIQAYKQSLADDNLPIDIQKDRTLKFWGRGTATTWEIVLPKSSINSDVKLSGLSQIEICIQYKALFKEKYLPLPIVTPVSISALPGVDTSNIIFPKNGTLFKEKFTGHVYVIFDGKKFLHPTPDKLDVTEINNLQPAPANLSKVMYGGMWSDRLRKQLFETAIHNEVNATIVDSPTPSMRV